MKYEDKRAQFSLFVREMIFLYLGLSHRNPFIYPREVASFDFGSFFAKSGILLYLTPSN